MSATLDAEKIIGDMFEEVGMSYVGDAMKIISKYGTEEGRRIMENDIRQLQGDSIQLVTLNFTIGTFASVAESELVQATNSRKYGSAKNWVEFKENQPKLTQGVLDQMAETSIQSLRADEVKALKKAKMLRSASDGVTETVNMLKKITERLMWQGSNPGNV